MRLLFISSEIEPKRKFDATFLTNHVIPIFYNSSPASLSEGYQQLLRLARKHSKNKVIDSVGLMCLSHTPYTLSFFTPMLHEVEVPALFNDDYEIQNQLMVNFVKVQEKVCWLGSSSDYHGDANIKSTSYKKLVKFLNSLQDIVSPDDTLDVDIISSLVATQGCVLMNSLRIDCEYVNVQTSSVAFKDDVDSWVLDVSNRQRAIKKVVDTIDRYFTEDVLYNYDLAAQTPGGSMVTSIRRDYPSQLYTNELLNLAHAMNTFRTSIDQEYTGNLFYGFQLKFVNVSPLDYVFYRTVNSAPIG